MRILCGPNRPICVVRATFTLFGTLAILGTFAAWHFLFVRSVQNSRQLYSLELQQVAELDHHRSVIWQQLAEVKEVANQWRVEQEQLRRRCSTVHNESQFLDWLNAQADEVDLVIRDFRPVARTLKSGYMVRGVALSASGSYESVCTLLDRLRDCPQMFRVNSLDIVPRDADGTLFSINLQGQLITAVAHRRQTENHEG